MYLALLISLAKVGRISPDRHASTPIDAIHGERGRNLTTRRLHLISVLLLEFNETLH